MSLPVSAIAQELYLDPRTVSSAISSLLSDKLIEKLDNGALLPCEDDLEDYIDNVLREVG
jgi:Mn-dependent DtxR family transcriptional regulator